MRCVKQANIAMGLLRLKKDNTFLLVAAFLLLINNVRTDADDYNDIRAAEEVGYWMYGTSTATSFTQKDKEMERNPNIDEKFIPNPNLNQHTNKAGNVWNRQPYTPMKIDFDAIRNWKPPTILSYTPRPIGIDLDLLRNWNPPTIKYEDITVPTFRYGTRRITSSDSKFFEISIIVLLVGLILKLCIWLIRYFRSRKPARSNLERIIIIGRESSPSQSDSVPSSTNPFLNKMCSNQSYSPLPQTNLETGSNDSKSILIPVQRDTSASASQSEHSQQSGVEDLRFSGREGSNPYSEPPPPYSNCVREGMAPPLQPPPSYSSCVTDGLISHPEPPPP